MGRFSKLELPEPGADASGAATTGDRDFSALAERCIAEGAYEPALRYYSRALAGDSKLESAWIGQLLCLFHLGELKEAVAWADRAITLLPESAEVVAVKAASLGRLGERERAMAVADGALKKSEVRALVWWARGDLLLTDNPSSAEHCFAKAAELAGDDWRLPYWIGLSYLSADRATDARRYLMRARSRNDQAAAVSLYLGFACRSLGLVDEAAQAFRHALDRNPGSTEAREALAKIESAGPVARLWTSIRSRFGR